MNKLKLGLVLIFVSCTADQEVIPADWKRIDAKYFEFMVPPGMERNTRAIAFDTFARSYESKTITLGFDYGPYSDSFDLTYATGVSDVVRLPRVVDGHEGTLISYVSGGSAYIMAIHFPELVKTEYDPIKLTIHVSSDQESDVEAMRMILGSLRFLK